MPELRELADRMFSRAAGAPLVAGNQVSLLEDARENYPAWLAAIRAARSHVHLESYFIQDDEIGREFADAMMAKARDGVSVRLLYDWLGGIGKTSSGFWKGLRHAGVEVRVFNPPRLSSPLGWLSRNHRKSLVIDASVGYISGLCIGGMWLGDPKRSLAPWRDTGIEVRGPAVADIERAFARTWALTGGVLPESPAILVAPPIGSVSLRIVSSEPASASLLRLDQLVASIARHRLWLTDAYYSGVTPYVQALRSAARDGVDVRLLVPHSTDIPLLRPISQTGYRPLIEAGVRVFEWNGTMLHAKTAVADGRWARVGSTNLNIASWLNNCELDAVIEDHDFADKMEALYLRDLGNATEVILDERLRVRAPGQPRRSHLPLQTSSGSTSGIAAGALRIGHSVGSAVRNRRVLGPVEGRLLGVLGLTMCALSILMLLFPRLAAYPVGALGLWGGLALVWKAIRKR